ncbi:hypothetical protein CYMTET_29009 [Cymbomonas tetramitiformis]|uniref:Uncharacterized protein n=1 Tax=Cymbomonas tetramitiformis TaxID=36881 RepID=A0AAE0KVM5_9CHLO|nr:hypothetical protein CYMTET_29009 [Cymbomonas tetramitiformis]
MSFKLFILRIISLSTLVYELYALYDPEQDSDSDHKNTDEERCAEDDLATLYLRFAITNMICTFGHMVIYVTMAHFQGRSLSFTPAELVVDVIVLAQDGTSVTHSAV